MGRSWEGILGVGGCEQNFKGNDPASQETKHGGMREEELRVTILPFR